MYVAFTLLNPHHSDGPLPSPTARLARSSLRSELGLTVNDNAF
jgi:hypothetical protein